MVIKIILKKKSDYKHRQLRIQFWNNVTNYKNDRFKQRKIKRDSSFKVINIQRNKRNTISIISSENNLKLIDEYNLGELITGETYCNFNVIPY